MQLIENSFDSRDEFNRRVIAENMLKLLRSNLNVSPILLDSEWGSGKSEFCEKLKNLAAKDKSNPLFIYIDAHSYDHNDDPLLMVLIKLSQAFPAEDERKSILKNTIPIIKGATKILGYAGANWLLKQDGNQVSEVVKEALKEGSTSTVDQLASHIFDELEKQDSNVLQLQKALVEITKEQKIVFIIDELDRCRPSFALSTLEKIKHIFSVPGVKFILSTNSRQLHSIIKKQYGYDLDANLYLEKFFRFKIKLPSNRLHRDKTLDNSYILFKNLIMTHPETNTMSFTPGDAYDEMFRHLFRAHKISLRQAYAFFDNILIYNQLASENDKIAVPQWQYNLIFLIGIFIYTFNDSLTNSFEKGEFSPDEIKKFFAKGQPSLHLKWFQDMQYIVEAFTIIFLAIDSNKIYPGTTSEDREVLKHVNYYINMQHKESPQELVRHVISILQMTKSSGTKR
jgi:hypothetical protein